MVFQEFKLAPYVFIPQGIYTIVIWATIYKTKPFLHIIQIIMLILALVNLIIMIIYVNKEQTGFAKILPLATMFMALYSLIPFLVNCMVIYSKGFHDCLGEWFAWAFSVCFLVLWCWFYIKTDNAVKEKFSFESSGGGD